MASHSLCGGQHIVNVGVFRQYALKLCILGIVSGDGKMCPQPRVWQLEPSVTANVELNFVDKCQTLQTLARKM